MPDAFTSLLSALAPALGLPEITVREDDPSCLLVIDDFEVSLRWLPEADMVMMFTGVGSPRPTIFTAKCAENHPRGEKNLCTMI